MDKYREQALKNVPSPKQSEYTTIQEKIVLHNERIEAEIEKLKLKEE